MKYQTLVFTGCTENFRKVSLICTKVRATPRIDSASQIHLPQPLCLVTWLKPTNDNSLILLSIF